MKPLMIYLMVSLFGGVVAEAGLAERESEPRMREQLQALEERLEEELAADPRVTDRHRHEAYLLAGREIHEAGYGEYGVGILEKALATSRPGASRVETLALLGLSYARAGNLEKAHATLETLEEELRARPRYLQDSNRSAVTLLRVVLEPSAHAHRLEEFVSKGEFASALALFSEPPGKNSPARSGVTYDLLLALNGQPDRENSAYAELLKTNPEPIAPAGRVALVLRNYRQGKPWDEALFESARETLEFYPDQKFLVDAAKHLKARTAKKSEED